MLRAVLWRIYQDRMRAAVAAARAGRYLGFAIIAVGLAELLVRAVWAVSG